MPSDFMVTINETREYNHQICSKSKINTIFFQRSNYSSSGTVSSSIGITWHCPSTNSSPSPHSTGIGSSAIISSPRPSDVGCSPPGYSRGSLVTIGTQFSPGEISCSPSGHIGGLGIIGSQLSPFLLLLSMLTRHRQPRSMISRQTPALKLVNCFLTYILILNL